MPEAGFALKTQQLFSTSTGAEQSLPLCLPRFTFTVCLRSQHQVFGDSFSNMKDEVLLMAISVGLTVIVFVLIAFIKKFIRSRPPGRRLVTSDIQVEADISLKRSNQCPSKKKTLTHHRYIKLHGWRFVFSGSVYNLFSRQNRKCKEGQVYTDSAKPPDSFGTILDTLLDPARDFWIYPGRTHVGLVFVQTISKLFLRLDSTAASIYQQTLK